MENIGISKAKVIESYNSYLFNDFTAIYKLLSDQLETKGSIDTTPIKAWLRHEVRVSDITKTTSERETPQPAPSSSTSQTTSTRPKKTCSSRQGLDKVFHNAKNRALSAIFNKNASDHGENGGGTKTKVKIKEMKNSGADHKTSTIASPLVSSLVSPRTVLDYPEPPSTSIFHRTVFCFSKKNATIKNNSSHQLPNSAR